VQRSTDDITSRQHSLITRAQATTAGLTRGAVRHRTDTRTWIEVHRNVFRVAAAPMTDRSTVMATVLAGGPDALTTSSTALSLHGIRGFERRLLPAIVGIPRRLPRRPAVGLVETLHLPPHHRTVVDGIPTATVARALFDYGATVGAKRLASAVDAALAAKKVTLPELDRVLHDLAERGRAGTTRMRAVLREREPGYRAPESSLEDAFVELLDACRLPEPERQVNPDGLLPDDERVDFAWPTSKLVVETDGGAFHDSPTDRARDERRDRALERGGWTVLRFGWNDVLYRPTSVRAILSHALGLSGLRHSA
jgi:very-short-patch-repair endonuclease